MMRPFVVGDRVRVVEAHDFHAREFLGREGTIAEIDPYRFAAVLPCINKRCTIEVMFNPDESLWFSPDELELL